MKKITIIIGLIISLTACSIFESKEKKAIEICQKSLMPAGSMNIIKQTENMTCLDYANMQLNEEPNKKFNWEAKSTFESNVYIVSFVDENGWGSRWEVDIEKKVVRFINISDYLCKKYNISRLDKDGNFYINNVKIDTLRLDNYSSSSRIVYILSASVINRSGKTLTKANISGNLKLIFEDKTIERKSYWTNGFITNISEYRPWENDTEKEFYVMSEGLEKLYLNYKPEYVVFEVNLMAEDPIGFRYDKNIEEYDLKYKWDELMIKHSAQNNENKAIPPEVTF